MMSYSGAEHPYSLLLLFFNLSEKTYSEFAIFLN